MKRGWAGSQNKVILRPTVRMPEEMLAGINADKEKIREEIKQLEEKKKNLSAYVDAAFESRKQKLDKKAQELASLQNTVAAQWRDFKVERKAFREEKEQDLRNRNEEWDRLSQVREKLAINKSHLIRDRKAAAEERTENARLKKELQALVAQRDRDLEGITKEKQDLEVRNEVLTKAQNELNERIKKMREDRVRVDDSISFAQQEVLRAKKAVADSEARIEAAEVAEENAKDAQRKLEAITQQNKQLAKTNSDFAASLKKLEDDLRIWREALDKREKQLDEREERVKALRDRLR
jgi:chromosome segregation ATPase